MPKAGRAGFATYWTSFGQGPREVLALHCSLTDGGSWGEMARYLSGACTLTAPDMPGHGRSDDWDARGEVQGVMTEIAADFLNGPTDIIGHSFGATVALRLAVSRPDLVRSLVLLEPVFFAVALRDHPEMAAELTALMADYVAAMEAGDYASAARGFIGAWGDGADWEAVPEGQRQVLACQMPLVAAGVSALYKDVGGMLAPGVLEAVRCPVLLVEGSRSPGIIGAIHEGLARRLPRSQRAVIMGAGHMAPITHPAQVSAEVLRFWREIPLA